MDECLGAYFSIIFRSSATAGVAAMRPGVSRLPRFPDFVLEAIHAFLVRVPVSVEFAPRTLQDMIIRCC